MARDLRGELENFDGEYPDPWLPKPGDILVGEVLRYEVGHTEYGPSPIVVLADEESGEELSVWLLHAVLRSEFQEQRPKVGERVGIKRLPDSGKGYRKYALRVDRPVEEVPDFERFAPAGDVPPEELEEIAAEARAEDEAARRGPDDDLPF